MTTTVSKRLLLNTNDNDNVDTFKAITTPSDNPPAGFFHLYFKSDGLFYVKDSSGNETQAALPFADNGDMLYYDNGVITVLPIGNSGEFISSDGNFPIWAAPDTLDEPAPNVFNGTGAQTAFTLVQTPTNENWIDVFVEGVYQYKTTYSVSGTTLTFTEAPPSGTANIEVMVRGY